MKNFSAPKNLMNKRNYSEIELIKDKNYLIYRSCTKKWGHEKNMDKVYNLLYISLQKRLS